MAQGDLYRLLNRISKTLDKEMKSESVNFRKRLERIPHDLLLDKKDLVREITLQIQDFKLASTQERTASGRLGQAFRKEVGSSSGNTREQAMEALNKKATFDGLSKDVVDAINKEAEQIIKSAASLAKIGKASSTVSVKRIGGDGVNTLVLRFMPKTIGVNSTYDAINTTIVKPTKDRMARLLEKLLKLDAKDTEDVRKRFFNVGHVRSVSEIKAARNLEALSTRIDRINTKYSDETSKKAADTLKLEILSKFTQFGNPEIRKEFLTKVALVKPESETSNQTDSVYEAAVLFDLRRALAESLAKMPNDWAKQKSSDSVIDFISKDILLTAQKRGARVNVDLRKLTKGNKASTNIKIERPAQDKTISSKLSVAGNKPTVSSPAQNSLSLGSLIPIINSRLPDVIRSQMGQAGRLVNRTGRFSESASVVSFDNYGFSYTYQRNPYEVFESQGARDPRTLIEGSIRQIASGLVDQKFNLRRV